MKWEKSALEQKFKNGNLPKLISLEEKILSCSTYKDISKEVVLGKLDFFIKHAYSVQKINTAQYIQELNKHPETLDSLYELVIKEYFKNITDVELDSPVITIDNFIDLCGIEVHYESLIENQQSKIKEPPTPISIVERRNSLQIQDNQFNKNELISELESEMLLFIAKDDTGIRGEKNIYRIKRLLENYKEKVLEILQFQYPAINIANGNINRFYYYIIQFINKRIYNDKKDNIWPDITHILEIVELISKDINDIDDLSQSKIMRQSKKLLKEHFNYELNKIKSLIKELNDKILASSKYKGELIKEILQDQLLKTLINQESIVEYEKVRDEIFEARICSNEEKEEKLYELKSIRTDQKNIGLSTNGFVTKYKLKVNKSKKNTKISEKDIFDQILNNALKNKTSRKSGNVGEVYTRGVAIETILSYEEGREGINKILELRLKELKDSSNPTVSNIYLLVVSYHHV